MQRAHNKLSVCTTAYMYVVEYGCNALQSHWNMHLPTQLHVNSSILCNMLVFVCCKARNAAIVKFVWAK